MSKTIKEIADEIGIDKQKVYRWVKKNCINEAHQKNGVMYFDDAEETLIKKAFSKNKAHHDVLQNHITDVQNDAIILLLKNELEAKNEQILNMQKLLDQEQQLRMLSEQKVLLLEAQTAEKDLENKNNTVEEQSAPEKKWWNFLKKDKKE